MADLIASNGTPFWRRVVALQQRGNWIGADMKALFVAAGMLLAAGALSSDARADGPRASSYNNWPGMTYDSAAAAQPGVAVAQPAAVPAPAFHWVWQEGYSHGGNWQGGWTRVYN
jgi:hypothetical protein